MKRIGILALVLVVALGALGIGYAKWSDTVIVNGSVETGEVCFLIDCESAGEVFHGSAPFNDSNWVDWVATPGAVSCPPGFTFTGIHEVDKDVASSSAECDDVDEDGMTETINFTIDNAYPYVLLELSFVVCNCGTIPIKIETPTITQDDGLLIQWLDNIGYQLHPGECVEISFYVGVTQTLPNGELTPQGTALHFSATVSAVQWNEYGLDD